MIDKSKKNKNYVLMDNLVSRSILIFNKIKSFFVNVSARNKTLYVLSLAKTKESITYIKTKTEDMKLYLKKGPRFFTERTPGLYGKISRVSKKIDFIPVKKYVVQTYK
jgi:hypothetical protein